MSSHSYTHETSGSTGKILGAAAALGGVAVIALAAVAAVTFNDPVAMMPATAAGPAALTGVEPNQASALPPYELPKISTSAEAWEARSYGASIGQ